MFEAFKGLFSGLKGAGVRTRTTKVVREFGPDGKVVKETVETSHGTGPVAGSAESEAAAQEIDKEVAKMDEFFDDMDKAFKKLFR